MVWDDKVLNSIIIQINNQFDKTKVDKDLKKKEEDDKSTKVLLEIIEH